MNTVINPLTNRGVLIGSTIYRSLINSGYRHDPITNRFITSEEEITPDSVTLRNIDLDPEYTIPIEKIVHLSDIHIPLSLHASRKDEYNSVFERLYNQIEHLENKVIVITGDLLHIKLSIEPETIIMARQFLMRLSELAPTILIIGNHDFTENNLERADSITAITNGLNIFSLKYSGFYRLSNILFSFSSLFDSRLITKSDIPTEHAHLKQYYLFHGTVIGSAHTTHHTPQPGKIYPTVETFAGFDAVLLGHIHKHHYIRPNIAYAGSLIQQNFGESLEHGIIIWNTADHSSVFVQIENDFAFSDVLIEDGKIINRDELDKLSDRQLRLRYKLKNTTKAQFEEAKQTLKLKIVSSKTINETVANTTIADTTRNDITELEILRKICPSDILESVLSLHDTIKSANISNTAAWNIRTLEFQNILIYGDDHVNTLNLEYGIYNICSPNMTGKSSIINIIMFALFDKISLYSSAHANIIHTGKTQGYIKLSIVHNDIVYMIHKIISIKKSGAKATYNYVTNFTQNPFGVPISLNGPSSTATLKVIAEKVGDFESFVTYQLIANKVSRSILQLSPADRMKQFHKMADTHKYESYIAESAKRRREIEVTRATAFGQLQTFRDMKPNMPLTPPEQLDELKQLIINTDECLVAAESRCAIMREELGKLSATQKVQMTCNMTAEEVELELSTTDPTPSKYTVSAVNKLLTVYKEYIKDETLTLQPVTASEISDDIGDASESTLVSLYEQYKAKCSHLSQIVRTCEMPSVVIDMTIGNYAEQIADLGLKLNTTDVTIRLMREKLKPCEMPTMPRIFADSGVQTSLSQELSRLLLIKQVPQVDPVEPIEVTATLEDLMRRLNYNIHKLPDCEEQFHEQFALYDILQLSKMLKPEYNFQTLPPQPTGVAITCKELLAKLECADDINKYAGEIIGLLKDVDSGAYTKYDLDMREYDRIRIYNDEIVQAREYNELIRQHMRHLITAEITNINHQIGYIKWSEYEIYAAAEKRILEIRDKLEVRKLWEIYDAYCSQVKQITELTNESEYLSAQIKTLTHKFELYVAWTEWQTYTTTMANISEMMAKVTTLEKLINNKKYYEQLKYSELIAEHTKLLEHSKRYERYLELCEYKKYHLYINAIQKSRFISAELTQLADYITQQRKLRNDAESKLKIAEKNNINNGICEQNITIFSDYVAHQDSIINIHTEYERLFHRTQIPMLLMKSKLMSFDSDVNSIFTKYTKYTFEHSQTPGGKLEFVIANKNTNLIIDQDRLSGFESIILQLSINYGINRCNVNKCGFMAIDESLDCIDERGFNEQLPTIMDTLRAYYNTAIIISHRVIPEELADKKIIIRPYSNYSRCAIAG